MENQQASSSGLSRKMTGSTIGLSTIPAFSKGLKPLVAAFERAKASLLTASRTDNFGSLDLAMEVTHFQLRFLTLTIRRMSNGILTSAVRIGVASW